MKADDIALLRDELLERMKQTWRTALEEQAALHGCAQATANNPRREDLRELKAFAEEDARSIANTFNQDIERRIIQLFEARPRGNRFYYLDELETWSEARFEWKSRQIAITTEQRVRFYAQDRFRQENGLRGQRYSYEGPPPVSDICKRRTAAGVVGEVYVQREPTPAHPNCPHEWIPLAYVQLGCTELWVG